MSDYHMTRMFVRFFKADPVRPGLCEIVLSQTPSRWDASASNSKKLSEEDGAMAVWGYFLIYCLRTAEDISRKYERNHQQESDTSVFQIRTEPDRPAEDKVVPPILHVQSCSAACSPKKSGRWMAVRSLCHFKRHRSWNAWNSWEADG